MTWGLETVRRLASRRLIPVGLVVTLAIPAGLWAVLAGPAAPAAADVGVTRVWRVSLPGTVIRESSILATDLDGDGAADVVVGGYDAKVRAFRGPDGSTAPGWPVIVNRGVNSSPAAADVDGDGRPEVIVGSGRALASDQVGRLNRIEHDGRLTLTLAAADRVTCPRDRPACSFPSPPVHSTPALGDVDRDRSVDITFGTLGLTSIWSISWQGAARPGFPFYADDTVFSSPALHDVDGEACQSLAEVSTPRGVRRGGTPRRGWG
ncbi:MAG: FG-GAP repeat domain-containing protein [Kineosporiaceae bacterium]